MKIEISPVPPPVRGFRFSGVHGGLKSRGRRDFALIVADRPVPCAAAFTTSRTAAAPVLVGRDHAADSVAQAVMVNSGCANAATGDQGLRFAKWSCREVASRLGIEAGHIIPCSTGVIGVQLDKVAFSRAISLGVDGLSRRGFGAAARAMMTSDAFPKWTHRTVSLGDGDCVVAGMAKGAGMIHPDMATMLAVVLTDADLSGAACERILHSALADSFNRITVDGDTSTNDTVVLMASGQAAGGRIDRSGTDAYAAVAAGVRDVMDELARMIVRDGEGATKVVDVVVQGAQSATAADAIAREVANSPLVKCAFAGADPNWGRFVMAVGKAGVDVEVSAISIDVDDVCLVRDGTIVTPEAARRARKAMRKDSFRVVISVGKGPGSATMVTSDLTEPYVRFNSAYTS